MNLSLISTILSALALGWAFLTHRRVSDAETRLENVRNSHFRLADRLRQEVEGLQGEVRALKAELRGATGAQRFYPEMTVQEAIELDPRAAEVMAGFHIGGCSGCAVNPTDTLHHAAEGNGQPADKLLAALNGLGEKSAAQVAEMLERKPNVQISL